MPTRLPAPLRRTLLAFAVPMLAGLPPSAAAAATIHRCQRDGRTVLTDQPCAGTPAATAPAPLVPAEAYRTPYGDWRGQAQYRATASGMAVPGAYQVTPVILTVARDGKVTGISPGNGCRLVGLAFPDSFPQKLHLDLTASNCRAKVLNQRYLGSLTVQPGSLSARLELSGHVFEVLRAPRNFELRAVLRR